MKDGWKTFTIKCGDENGTEELFDLYIEDGKVLRGTNINHTRTLYPYKSVKDGMENASGVKYETFRIGYKKGIYDMR